MADAASVAARKAERGKIDCLDRVRVTWISCDQLDLGPYATPVAKGMILNTSGVTLETFPPGIPVGRVTSVSTDAGALHDTVTLAPLINPSQLLVVSVLIYSGQTP